jgi:hypothetical protein
MSVQSYEEIIDKYIKCYNAFDIDGMMSVMHENVKFENISDGKVNLSTKGIPALRSQAEKALELFTKRTQEVINLKIKGNKAEATIDFQGVIAVDLPNGFKAGEQIEMSGKSIFRFEENKIIELKDIS